jgi:hypothetical protein
MKNIQSRCSHSNKFIDDKKRNVYCCIFFWQQYLVCFLLLETVEDNIFGMTNFLIHEKGFDIGSLITRQLNHFTHVFILLHGTIAGKILFKRFADAFNVQIVRQTGDCRDAFASIALLYTHVHLFFRTHAALGITSVFKGV